MAIASRLRRVAAFQSLRNRDFRWFWLGRLATYATMEMGAVAQGWLAYQLTGSALAVGWVAAGRSLALLILSLWGGALADRLEKRQVMIWTRSAMAVNALTVGLLAYLGLLRVGHLVAYSIVSGVIESFLMPARQAFLAQLVDRKTLLNAMSLNSVGLGLMAIIGPSLAGFVIAWFGAGGVYLVMAALFASAVYTLGRLPPGASESLNTVSIWEDLREGVGYLKVCKPILPLLGVALIRALFGWSYRTLMPVYAEEVLHYDARGLGLLSSAPGLGSLVASLLLALLGNSQRKGHILFASGVVMGLSLIAFANTPHLLLVIAFLALAGAARNAIMVTNQTLIQNASGAAFRGRVQAMYFMVMGLVPLGTIPAGAIADAWGIPLSLTLQGGMMIGLYGLLWFLKPRIKDMG